MKTKTKVVLLALCMAALIVVSVLGTMAYLTSTDQVVNTFTVGNVAITLDEADVDSDTNTADNVGTGDAIRDKANKYHLLPGHTYTKDPTIHVDADSEDCYLFIKVENGIAAYEDATNNIASQISNNGWIALTDVANVYYCTYTKGQTDKNIEIFSSFKIADNANDVTGWTSISESTTKINVTAYAVQKDGFDTAEAAWGATFGKSASTNP